MEEIIYSFDSVPDWDIYNEGWEAWDDYLKRGIRDEQNTNTYTKNTNKWYNWNKGWNQNTNN